MRRELLGAGAALAVFLGVLIGVAFFSSRSHGSGSAPVPGTPPRRAGLAAEDSWVGELIMPPRPAPDFELLDRSGSPLTLGDLKGKLVLLSFAYTACPDVCPLLFSRFLRVQESFADRIGRDLVLVFMTVDPQVDTPERLNEWTESVGGRWYFLTGAPAKMEQVWKDYRIYVQKSGLLVSHSSVVYLIDGNGLIRLRYGGIPPTEALISDIKGWLGK